MAVNRIAYLYTLLLSFIFFVLFDVYLLHLFLVFLLLLPLFSLLLAIPASRGLRYKMEIEDDIVPKGPCPVSLTIKNGSVFPCARVRLLLSRRNALGRSGEQYSDEAEDSVQCSMGPNRTITLQPVVKFNHCGRMDLSIRRVYVCDLLGLFSLPVPATNGVSASGSVYVLPELQTRSIQTDEAADLGLDSVTYSTERAGNDPSEIFQLRDYREGDPRHSVHWKLSSRMNRLIVREFGLPLNASLHFLLELREGADPAAAEAMLGAVLAFSEYLMARKITHSVSWIGEEGMLQTLSVTGADALASVLHDLLALPAQERWSTLEQYSAQATPQGETHVVYLIAGARWKSAEDEEAKGMLGNLLERNICRRLTLMTERCPQETAKGLLSFGCEVQLFNGRTFGIDAEEAL